MAKEENNVGKAVQTVKIGKSAVNIAKAASATGVKGAAIQAAKEFKEPLIAITLMVLIVPAIVLIMLPTVIFNGLNDKDSINNSLKVMDNVSQIKNSMNEIMIESYENVVDEVNEKTEDDEHSIVRDNVSGQVEFDANLIIAQYSISKNYKEISIDDMISVLTDNKDKLYDYTVHTEEREISEEETVTYTIYTIDYAGEEYLADKVFKLNISQKGQAVSLSQNLALFLEDNKNYAQINNVHRTIAELIEAHIKEIESTNWSSPIDADWKEKITSRFGKRILRGRVNYHTGLDMGIETGTTVKSIMSGKVIIIQESDIGYGKYVVIYHGSGYVSLYAHCSSILVAEGEEIGIGQEIAKSGNTGNSTGPHLHLEIIKDGVLLNPEDELR